MIIKRSKVVPKSNHQEQLIPRSEKDVLSSEEFEDAISTIKPDKISSKNLELLHQQKQKKHKYSLNYCRSREEEVLLTLQVLEKEHGINLYDSNAYGGMWLKSNKNKEEHLKNIFIRHEKIENSTKVNNENNTINNNNIPINLINFFKNGK